MAPRIYYVHLAENGEPTGPRVKYLGTQSYGYQTLAGAIRSRPDGAAIQARYSTESDDWAGHIVVSGDGQPTGDYE